MAKLTKITKSFNAGEISPLMDSRSDQAKYDSGCKTMENFYPSIFGSASRRPGLEYIATQKANTFKGRSVDFEHSVDDTYVLTFENQNIRFFKNGDRVMNDALVVSGITTPSAAVLVVTTTTAHQMSTGDVVRFADVAGTTEVNYNGNDATEWPITVVSATTFSLDDTLGANFSLYSSAGTVASIYEKTTPYLSNDLPQLKFEQSADVVFITHPAYEERKLSRTGDTAWFLLPNDLRTGPFRDQNTDTTKTIAVAEIAVGGIQTGASVTLTAAGHTPFTASVAAVSIASFADANNSQTTVTAGAAHGLVAGDRTSIDGTASYNGVFTVKSVSSTTVFVIDAVFVATETGTSTKVLGHVPSGATIPITAFADYNGTYASSTKVTAATHGFSTADIIQITGTTSYNGQWNITKIDANDFYIKTPFVANDATGEATYANYKVQTGALYGLKYSAKTVDLAITELASQTLNAATGTLFVPKDETVDYTTQGTWGAADDPATVVLERTYDGTNYGTVSSVTSAANKNVGDSFTETVDDALYRWRVSSASTATTTIDVHLALRDPTRSGIVEITSVASTTSATGTVRKTLGESGETAIAATHRWSEGSYSNNRGYPIDVAISSEERLTFAGNLSDPLTVIGSAIGDFSDFTLGTNDDDAIQFTLVGTGQQNRIRWMVAKDALVLGTVGGEHLLGASKNEEALTPTNVKAKIQTTYGSEDIKAKIVNQAVLFTERGGKKIREFLYNFEADSHKADDLTVFAEHITGDGIVDVAFQRTPDPRLWCVRTDGQMAVMVYERDQNIFSWYRIVTDGSFESVAVIYGGSRAEDQVWVTVKRVIGGVDKRYIERFTNQEFDQVDEAVMLDSAKTNLAGTVSGDLILASDTVRFGEGVFGSSLFGGTA
jgi:hypothetical protein